MAALSRRTLVFLLIFLILVIVHLLLTIERTPDFSSTIHVKNDDATEISNYVGLLNDTTTIKDAGENATLGYLTIITNKGRLGNQMFTFATLLGLCRSNRRPLLLPNTVHEALTQYFDISFPMVDLTNFVESNPWKIGNWLRPQDRFVPAKCNMIHGNKYPTSYTFFWDVRDEVRRHFRFRPHLRSYADDLLAKVRGVRTNTQTIVGIHVRRGDYVKKSKGGWLREFEGREVDLEYFRRAMRHFRSRYSNVSFLATSDDRDWVQRHLAPLGVLTAPESPTAGHDLALLSACDHVITTYGTYGFWAGFLSGGEVTYFSAFLRPNTSMTNDYFREDKMFPPEWVGISTTPDGYWDQFKDTTSHDILYIVNN